MIRLNSKQRPLHPSLQAKLELLENLQKGNLQRVRQLTYALSKVGKTNPELYGKLLMFVEQHKDQRTLINNEVNELGSEDESKGPQIVNIDQEFLEGKEWDSDESIEYESDQEADYDKENQNTLVKYWKKQTAPKKSNDKKELFRQIKNKSQRRSISNKKPNLAPKNTYQFKSATVAIQKFTQSKPAYSKPEAHKNSAIARTRTSVQH